MNRRPVIGITTHRRLENDAAAEKLVHDPGEEELILQEAYLGTMLLHPGYVRSIEAAGGVPLVIPMTEQAMALAELCDGFLLTGSEADVDPTLFGKQKGSNRFVDEQRDRLDFELLKHSEQSDKPVFGICRGCQVMNVYRGGSLALDYHDLVETSINHDGDDLRGPLAHEVSVEPNTLLSKLADDPHEKVNSLHKQVVERLGSGLKASAKSEDGLIEAIEDAENPERYYAVQWHPERAPDEQTRFARRLFDLLVETAYRYRETHGK